MLKKSDWGKIFKVQVGRNRWIHLKVDEEGGIGYCDDNNHMYDWGDKRWNTGRHQHWGSHDFERDFIVVFELPINLENK